MAIGIFGMAITIIVKKDGKFPDGEISHNKALRKQGIICAKEEELRMWGKKGSMRRKKGDKRISPDCSESGCQGCAFHNN